MTRQAFIRALIGVVGVFAIVRGLEQLHNLAMVSGMALLWAGRSGSQFHWVWPAITSALVPAALIAVGVKLLVSPPQRLLGTPAETEPATDSGLSPWAVCHITAAFAGVLILCWALPRISQLAYVGLMRISANFTIDGQMFGPSSPRLEWYQMAVTVLELALGVYLLLGAPRFVRWQVRKIEALHSTQRWPAK